LPAITSPVSAVFPLACVALRPLSGTFAADHTTIPGIRRTCGTTRTRGPSASRVRRLGRWGRGNDAPGVSSPACRWRRGGGRLAGGRPRLWRPDERRPRAALLLKSKRVGGALLSLGWHSANRGVRRARFGSHALEGPLFGSRREILHGRDRHPDHLPLRSRRSARGGERNPAGVIRYERTAVFELGDPRPLATGESGRCGGYEKHPGEAHDVFYPAVVSPPSSVRTSPVM
jgi:hypothetical protein